MSGGCQPCEAVVKIDSPRAQPKAVKGIGHVLAWLPPRRGGGGHQIKPTSTKCMHRLFVLYLYPQRPRFRISSNVQSVSKIGVMRPLRHPTRHGLTVRGYIIMHIGHTTVDASVRRGCRTTRQTAAKPCKAYIPCCLTEKIE